MIRQRVYRIIDRANDWCGTNFPFQFSVDEKILRRFLLSASVILVVGTLLDVGSTLLFTSRCGIYTEANLAARASMYRGMISFALYVAWSSGLYLIPMPVIYLLRRRIANSTPGGIIQLLALTAPFGVAMVGVIHLEVVPGNLSWYSACPGFWNW